MTPSLGTSMCCKYSHQKRKKRGFQAGIEVQVNLGAGKKRGFAKKPWGPKEAENTGVSLDVEWRRGAGCGEVEGGPGGFVAGSGTAWRGC